MAINQLHYCCLLVVKMGSGNCSLCQNARQKDTQIQCQLESVKPEDIKLNLTGAAGHRGSSQSSFQPKNSLAKPNDRDSQAHSVSKQSVHMQPPDIQSRYVGNHILVPNQIVLKHLTDNTKLLIKKEIPDTKLLDADTQWVLLSSGNYYSGELRDEKPVGEGIYVLNNGNVYWGETKEEMPSGFGVYINTNGIYKGLFQDGRTNGRGKYQGGQAIVDGMWEFGQIRNGRYESKHLVYQGQFANGLPEGKGVYQQLASKVHYQGEFLGGKFDGRGIYRCERYTYEGEFKQGKRHGVGSITDTSKDRRSKAKEYKWNMDSIVQSS